MVYSLRFSLAYIFPIAPLCYVTLRHVCDIASRI